MDDMQFIAALEAARSAKNKEFFQHVMLSEGSWERLLPLAKVGAELARKAAKKPRAKSAKPDDEPEGFAAWYAEYPIHVARAAGARAYRSALKKTTPEILLAAARRYRADCAGKDKKFIKHPSTWLNSGCWADEPVSSQAAGNVAAFASIQTWVSRLEMFFGFSPDHPKGTWFVERMGLPPNQTGNSIPPQAWDEFRRIHPTTTAISC